MGHISFNVDWFKNFFDGSKDSLEYNLETTIHELFHVKKNYLIKLYILSNLIIKKKSHFYFKSLFFMQKLKKTNMILSFYRMSEH